MEKMKSEKRVFLILVVGRKQKDRLLSALSESGARLLNVVYGKGTVEGSYLKRVLGLTPEENKAVITCLMTSTKADAVLQMLALRFDFDKPNTGIAFTIPVDRVSY